MSRTSRPVAPLIQPLRDDQASTDHTGGQTLSRPLHHKSIASEQRSALNSLSSNNSAMTVGNRVPSQALKGQPVLNQRKRKSSLVEQSNENSRTELLQQLQAWKKRCTDSDNQVEQLRERIQTLEQENAAFRTQKANPDPTKQRFGQQVVRQAVSMMREQQQTHSEIGSYWEELARSLFSENDELSQHTRELDHLLGIIKDQQSDLVKLQLLYQTHRDAVQDLEARVASHQHMRESEQERHQEEQQQLRDVIAELEIQVDLLKRKARRPPSGSTP